jgi:hypothetical protein
MEIDEIMPLVFHDVYIDEGQNRPAILGKGLS